MFKSLLLDYTVFAGSYGIYGTDEMDGLDIGSLESNRSSESALPLSTNQLRVLHCESTHTFIH